MIQPEHVAGVTVVDNQTVVELKIGTWRLTMGQLIKLDANFFSLYSSTDASRISSLVGGSNSAIV